MGDWCRNDVSPTDRGLDSGGRVFDRNPRPKAKQSDRHRRLVAARLSDAKFAYAGEIESLKAEIAILKYGFE